MDVGKKPTVVLYLERSRFDLYSEEQNNVYNFDLAPFVANLEIVNKQDLEKQVTAFVSANKITPGNIIIVLSENVLFVKALAPTQDVEVENSEIQKFRDSVPFEHIEVKSYKIEGGKLLVAANQDLYYGIKSFFEKCGFMASIIAPIYAAGITVDPSHGLSVEAAKFMLKNADTLKLSGLETIEEKKVEVKSAPSPKGASNKTRLFALVGVFAVLLLILLFVLINSLSSTPAKSTVKSKVASNPSPTAPVQTASSAATLSLKDIRIKIVSPESAASSAGILLTNLENFGFVDVKEEKTTIPGEAPLIIFTPSVPAQVRTQIANNVSQVAGNFTVQEANTPEADVTIFLLK